jgi:hypothetical protein
MPQFGVKISPYPPERWNKHGRLRPVNGASSGIDLPLPLDQNRFKPDAELEQPLKSSCTLQQEHSA